MEFLSEIITWINKEFPDFFSILFIVFLILISIVAIRNTYRKEKLCKACGTIDKPVKKVPGSLILEIILWLFFLLPGICYTAYRMARKYWACDNCGSRDIIPLDSPLAQKFIREHNLQPEPGSNIKLEKWPPKPQSLN